MELFLVACASLLAGFVDSIVGGGGLVLVPALFAAFPTTPPATLFGVNKSASLWGTAVATVQYSRRVTMDWPVLLPAAAMSLAGALAGAWLVTVVSPEFLRKLLPVVLVVVLIYTLAKKELGRHHAPRLQGWSQTLTAGSIGLLMGFYDGFFGPGTGSFLVFLLVRVLGFDFLQASAHSKVMNLCSNLAAVILLASQGHVWWQVGITLALANVAGSLLGTRMAMRHGSGFVRYVFIVVVTVLALKTAKDAWF